MVAPDPAAVERQFYVDLHLGGVDNPSLSLAQLRNKGAGSANAYRAVIANEFDEENPEAAITAHWQLTGLGDDDHTQYHNDYRGDLRYYQKTETYNQEEVDALLGAYQPQVVEYRVNSNAFLTEEDAGKLFVMQSDTDTNVTIPDDTTQNLPIGAKVDVIVAGPGAIEIIYSGDVTVNGYDIWAEVIHKSTSPGSKFTVQKTAPNTWFAYGDLYETDIVWQVVVDPATDVRLDAYRVLWVGGEEQPANMAVGDLWVKDAA